MSTSWLEQEYVRRDSCGVCDLSLNLQFDSRASRVPRIVDRLVASSEAFDWVKPGDRLYFSVALEEALLNSVIHGNLEVSSGLREAEDGSFERMIRLREEDPHYGERMIYVTMEINREQVSWRIRDQGPGFDVQNLPDPRGMDRVHLVSGRGILMIRSIMDRLDYNASGNEIRFMRRNRSVSASRLESSQLCTTS